MVIYDMGKIKLGVQSEEFTTTPLAQYERELFEEQMKELFYPPWNLERQFILSKRSIILAALEAAKNALDDKTFGGFNAGANEIGMSPIRPGHVGLCHDGTYTNAEADNAWKWVKNATAPSYNTGFDGWIHSPSADTTAFTVHKDSFILPLYIVEESASPKLQTVKIDVGRTDVLYYDVSAARIRDAKSGISLYPLPTTFWGPNTDVLVAVQAKESGTLDIRLGGLTFALGTFLDATTYQPDGNTVETATVATT